MSLESNEEGDITLWGNNFSVYFELLMEKMHPEIGMRKTNSFIGPIYQQSLQELGGEKWEQFVEENESLLENIFQKLKYIRELDTKSPVFLESRDQVWEYELNPLLQEAAFKMMEYGLDVEEFKK